MDVAKHLGRQFPDCVSAGSGRAARAARIRGATGPARLAETESGVIVLPGSGPLLGGSPYTWMQSLPGSPAEPSVPID